MHPSVENFLSKEYDRLYNEASKLIKKYNPCKITDGKCLNGGPKCCCGGCRFEYLTSTGCSVQSLGCRLFLCGFAIETAPQIRSKMDRLREYARYLALNEVYYNKEQTLERAKKSEFLNKFNSVFSLLAYRYFHLLKNKQRSVYHIWWALTRDIRMNLHDKYRKLRYLKFKLFAK
jgi:hypothetical protein